MPTRREALTAMAATSLISPAFAAAEEPGRILITGAAGRIGGTLLRALPGSAGPYHVHDEGAPAGAAHIDLSTSEPDFSGVSTVIHCAGILKEDIDTAEYNSRITYNVLRACRKAKVSRLIWASSVRADEAKIGFPISYYGAQKAAQEAMLVACAAEDPERHVFAMRYGHFLPGSKPPASTEVLRLEESSLVFWMRRALAWERKGLTTWIVMGRT